MKGNRCWMIKNLLAPVLLVFSLLLMGGAQASADPLDDPDPSLDHLQEHADGMNKMCETPEGEAFIRSRLRDRFQIGDPSITELRNQGLGYGEIGILHSLSEASGTEASELLRLRQEEKMGWGKIAGHVNTSVGDAMRHMRELDKEPGDPDRVTQKPGKPEKGVKTKERFGKPEKTERPEKADRSWKSMKSERPPKPEKRGKF